ncbi:MAG: phage resistance protein, partial [Bradymonadaceae bacterium]
RPAPIFSFVARQRDLSEMIGEAMSGEEETRIDLSIEWGQGRFKVIELEDRNLPAIAQQRLLRPKDADAREQIRQSFDETIRSLSDRQRQIMETSQHGEDEFRRIYPFSPALMQSLIVLSNELQHERSALKVMQLLLQRHAGHLELGDIIPVGVLWPVLADGDEPYDPVKKKHFRKAKDLYEYKLLPVLERQHDVEFDEVERALQGDDPLPADVENFRNDARILQTLLLAAIVPNLEVFENMTPQRLLALNHGTLQAPIPGAEEDQLVKKLRTWSTEISELHMTDPRTRLSSCA